MGTELSNAEKNALSVDYEVGGSRVVLDLPFIRQYLVRGDSELVTDQEVIFFMNLCKTQRLNPLVGSEVYLIKYSSRDPAQVVIGKAAYMKRAFEHPEYLCKEDGITVQRGSQIVQKEGCCLYPGEKLIGGWCRIHFIRNGKERTAFKEVSLSEYDKGMANWKSKPATMINKVSVSQCAREAFPKDYEGLYSEDELVASGVIPTTYEEIGDTSAEPVDLDTEIINQEKKQEFLIAIQEKFPTTDDRNIAYQKILAELGLNSMHKMTLGMWKKAMDRVSTLYEETFADAEETQDVPAEEEAE